ncbi:hypothetical protein TL16_g04967 [Triparma laevis f. inornata]|uniref:Uncharacterized protein n=1 Tax=Triparma laevis f. inornata TaxID=1714386 RepID=A0A9W7AEQ7_9STRA|nr:hypothetical protein TL16_g04967 [Triparma laevis f. inornata]
MSGRNTTAPISIGDGSNTPKASNARQIPTTQLGGVAVGGAGGEARHSTVGFETSTDFDGLQLNPHAAPGALVSHSLPAPRAPFLRSRDPLDRLRNMPAIELPGPNGNGIVDSGGGGSSSLLSGHAFPSNFGSGGGGGGGWGGVGGGVGVGGGDGGGMSGSFGAFADPNVDIFPHSLPTYPNRDFIHRRWEETRVQARNRQGSISSDSSDFNGGGGHGNSMSTSLTVFDILESSRPGLGVVLNANEVNNALNSRRETIEALQSVGGIEGEEIMVSDEVMEDEELGAFELDLDD